MNNEKGGCEKYIIRRVTSIEELRDTFYVLAAQFTPPLADDDRICADLMHHYPQDRQLMLLVEKDEQTIGGALGFGSTLRIIALELAYRGKGLGQRLIQTFEVAAMRHGVHMISLGAVEQAKDFYVRMGYRGKSSMHKELPLPGRVLELRLRKLEALIGDLDVGQVVQTDEKGKISPLF